MFEDANKIQKFIVSLGVLISLPIIAIGCVGVFADFMGEDGHEGLIMITGSIIALFVVIIITHVFYSIWADKPQE